MKRGSLIAVALATVSWLVFNVPAQATIITPAQANSGFTVSEPESGSITYTGLPGGSPVSNQAVVTVPGDTTIDLTYTLTGAGSILTSLSDTYTAGSINGGADSIFIQGASGAVDSPIPSSGGSYQTSAAYVFANLTSPNSGVIDITNDLSTPITFKNEFLGVFGSAGAQEVVSFNVSSVPLPATLSMFGTVMLGLFGFGWMKRRQNYSQMAA